MLMVTNRSNAGAAGWVMCALAVAAVTGATRASAQSHAHWLSRARGVDRVPQDFATLQDAIDLGRGRKIRVASGEYAGAVVNRPVAISCQGQCMISSGVAVGALQAGLVFEAGADGSQVRGFDFVDLDLGVYASCETLGSLPDRITIERNTFVNNAQGVTVNGVECDGGDGWQIERNRFHDLRSDISQCGGGLGVYLIAIDDADVTRNLFRGEIAAPPCGPQFTTAGIYLSGTSGVRVERNDFELGDGGHPFKLDIALFPEDGANEDVVITFNDARGSAAPFEGVNFLSIDSVGVRARCNSGTTALEHGESEGTSERYSERGCRRTALP